MGRQPKLGLDYFPFDVDFFDDEKLIAISGEFGIKGEYIVIRVLCAIYRSGYFARWSEALKMKIAKESSVNHQTVQEVINAAVKWGMFNQHLFDEHKVLTSNGIQKRYYEAARKRINENLDLSFWVYDLKPRIHTAEKDITASEKDITAADMPQIKSNHIISHDLKGKDILSSRRERAAALYLENFGPAGTGALEEMIDFYGDDIVFQAVDRSIGKAKTAPIVYVNRVCTQICNGEKEYKLNWQARNGE